MSFFSKACAYAIRSMVVLAVTSKDGSRFTVEQLAEKTGAPKAYTSKVMQSLVKAGLLLSTKGPNGGLELPSNIADTTTLAQVVDLIDGDSVYTQCLLGYTNCPGSKPCCVHDELVHVREQLQAVLAKTTISELAKGHQDLLGRT